MWAPGKWIQEENRGRLCVRYPNSDLNLENGTMLYGWIRWSSINGRPGVSWVYNSTGSYQIQGFEEPPEHGGTIVGHKGEFTFYKLVCDRNFDPPITLRIDYDDGFDTRNSRISYQTKRCDATAALIENINIEETIPGEFA